MAVSIYCPFCHRHTSLEPAPVQVSYARNTWTVDAVWQKDYLNKWWIGVCNYCGSPVLVNNDADIVYPTERPTPTDAAVPDSIRRDLDEAKQCFAAGCHRAAAVMARRAMQAAAIEKGATKDRLVDQIAELASSHMITTDLKEWADVVRWVGNDAAHPNGDEVSSSDAEEVISLAEQFLHVLYVAPAKAKQLRAKKGK